jgi:BirA family transcriptional regulator, biotin operon repressor / biotin---[acetyl-CoA-carboxylase] ligase
MAAQIDVLDLDKIEPRLNTKFVARPAGRANELWESINSTNTRATQLAANGGAHGTLILARQQSAGRGRLGRQWVSPADSGIYASFLLRPDPESVPNLSTITLGVGVAVARAIRNSVGIDVGLKWVNDLVVDGRKLGGILCEMSARPSGNALIIGIGINVRFSENELPDDLKDKMTWLERVTKQPVDPNFVIAEVANQLEEIYELLLSGKSSLVLSEWRTRSITLGRRIVATSGEKTIEGVAVDIATSGALIVELDGGRTELHAGEITIRNADGSYC